MTLYIAITITALLISNYLYNRDNEKIREKQNKEVYAWREQVLSKLDTILERLQK